MFEATSPYYYGTIQRIIIKKLSKERVATLRGSANLAPVRRQRSRRNFPVH